MSTVNLWGATYNDVPRIDVPDGNGGISSFYDPAKINWLGRNPYDMGQIYSLSTTLNNTLYNGWTPSTTAKNIVTSVDVTPTVSMDLEHYDYIVLWYSECEVAYNSNWSASKGSPLKEVCLYTQSILRRPANYNDANNGIFNYNASQNGVYYIYWCYYWSSSSAKSLAYTTYSPCYISAVTACSFNSTSSTTPTVTLKTPVLSARCSTTYFTTANAAKVDQANTTVKLKGHLYRVDMGTSAVVGAWHELDRIWINGL